MLICEKGLIKNQSANRNCGKEKPFASFLSAQQIYSAAGAAEAHYDGALTHWSLSVVCESDQCKITACAF